MYNLDDWTQCSDFKNRSMTKLAKFQRERLWSGWCQKNSGVEDDEVIFGLADALTIIHHHQNPRDCSTAKFLLAPASFGGFGSQQHVVGVGLAVAMMTGRVYIQHPGGPLYYGLQHGTQ